MKFKKKYFYGYILFLKTIFLNIKKINNFSVVCIQVMVHKIYIKNTILLIYKRLKFIKENVYRELFLLTKKKTFIQ